jgi:hypothetical protein
MPEKKTARAKKTSGATAKQEMLTAYGEVIRDLDAQREAEMKPEEKLAEKATRAAVAAADGLTTERIAKEIGILKTEIVKTLAEVADKLDAEVARYAELKRAVEAKEQELQEIYDIPKSASTLTALLEVQQQKREEFEAEMAARKEELTAEIATVKAAWDDEKKRHDAEAKEREAAEKKTRDREKEDYEYRFKREQQLTREKFEDEKARLDREMQATKAAMEAALADREKAIAAQEKELAELRARVQSAPKEQEAAVAKAVKEATERAQHEAKTREEIARKESDGDRNVLLARIESLEKTAKEQATQVAKLSQQLDRAYGQVQDIAVKTVEGCARAKATAQVEQFAAEQSRKTATEK